MTLLPETKGWLSLEGYEMAIRADERRRYYEEAARIFEKRWNARFDAAVLKAFEDAAT